MNHFLDDINHAMVRVECVLSNGNVSCGTGYIYQFRPSDGDAFLAVVTNAHVVRGGSVGRFNFTLKNVSGKPDIGNYETIELPNLQSCCCYHPLGNDLAIIKLENIFHYAREGMNEYYFKSLSDKLIQNDNDLKKLFSVEDILMVGYPNGIWDEAHNLPIFRRGVTASHPGFDLNGEREFVIDVACFPGSSGSPVFVYNNQGYIDRDGNSFFGGERIIFLGTLRGGRESIIKIFRKDLEGDIHEDEELIATVPNNLGFVIKASELLHFNNITSAAKQTVSSGGTSRNSPCPCGSGKKYKNCCGKL